MSVDEFGNLDAPMNSDHAPTAEEQLPPLSRSQITAELAVLASRAVATHTEHLGHTADAAAGIYAAYTIIRERQLLAALRENREKDARIAELERKGMWDCDMPTVREAIKRAEAAEAKLRAAEKGADAEADKAAEMFRSVISAQQENTDRLLRQLAEKDAYLSERNKRMHGKFGFMADPDGSDKCACAYCSRDVEALADHAAEMECELFLPSGLKARAEAAEAKLRAVSDALDGKPVTVFHVRELEYYLRSEVDEPIARIRAIVEGK